MLLLVFTLHNIKFPSYRILLLPNKYLIESRYVEQGSNKSTDAQEPHDSLRGADTQTQRHDSVK